MTRTAVLFLLITLLSPSAMAQDVIGLDPLMKENKIKTKTQYECDHKGESCKTLYQWTYDSLGRLTKSIDFSANEPFLTATYFYNKFNKVDSVYRQFKNEAKYLSQMYKFNGRGDIMESYDCFAKEGCRISEKNQYNRLGQLQKKIEFGNKGNNTETDYLYDKAGNNIETKMKYTNSGGMINKLLYDEKNNLVMSTSYTLNGEELDHTKFEYDKNGNLTHLHWMGGLNTNNLYTYDDLGNELEYKSMAPDGQLSDHRIMTYQGKLVMTRIHYEKAKISRYFKFDYEKY